MKSVLGNIKNLSGSQDKSIIELSLKKIQQTCWEKFDYKTFDRNLCHVYFKTTLLSKIDRTTLDEIAPFRAKQSSLERYSHYILPNFDVVSEYSAFHLEIVGVKRAAKLSRISDGTRNDRLANLLEEAAYQFLSSGVFYKGSRFILIADRLNELFLSSLKKFS